MDFWKEFVSFGVPDSGVGEMIEPERLYARGGEPGCDLFQTVGGNRLVVIGLNDKHRTGNDRQG